MQLTENSKSVFYAKERFVQVKKTDIAFLKKQIKTNRLNTTRICAHDGVDNPIQEMIIAHVKGNYIHPHKHPGKTVSYHVIEGKADLVIFDEAGKIKDVILLGTYNANRTFYFRMPTDFFYAPYVRSNLFIFHETLNGPFKQDTEFAPWAPTAQDELMAWEYWQDLDQKIKKFLRKRI